MTDLEKLIKAVRLCGSTPKADQCKQCAYWAGGDMSRCIPNMTGDAATELSTLQAEVEFWKYRCNESVSHASELDIALYDTEAENEKLRDEVERQRRSADDRQHLYENAERAYIKAQTELEQVKRELDICIKAVFGDCDYCKYDRSLPDDTSPCWHCKEYAAQEFVTGNYWQWRGQKES